jgi:hypothetical protein
VEAKAVGYLVEQTRRDLTAHCIAHSLKSLQHESDSSLSVCLCAVSKCCNRFEMRRRISTPSEAWSPDHRRADNVHTAFPCPKRCCRWWTSLVKQRHTEHLFAPFRSKQTQLQRRLRLFDLSLRLLLVLYLKTNVQSLSLKAS